MATLVQNLLRVGYAAPARLSEREQFLASFNNTARTYPRDKCVHELFEKQVERSPEAIAVVSKDTQLTYAELNARANQLARFLKRFGVGPDSLVGLCVERSPEMMVGILGILKAGAGYVPLDPTYPHERLSFMMQDANIFVLLTQSHLVDSLPPHSGPRLSLDSDWDIIAKERKENTPSRATPENLSYVIYTSGSTGKPKGVMISHRGLVNYLSWCTEAYEVAKGCGAPVHSSISFDLTITSLFSPLMVGRSVFLVADGIENLVEALLARDNYSLVKITPAHLRALAELMPEDEVAGRVRALIIGGEALNMESLAFWRTHAASTRLINEYGPTETVVGCSVYEVAADDPVAGPVPIGRPVGNTQLHVLNERLEPVEKGVTGELYIGGDGVALGYLRRRELTDERFIPDPHSKNGHSRLYRTGDLARFNDAGILEYLGRIDSQVKIKGFRIELGEVETILNQHPGVRECAVLASEDATGEKRLIAYVVRDPQHRGEMDELRKFMKAKVPDYMVPTSFVNLESLPLTKNGKVDRQALPAPERKTNGCTQKCPSKHTAAEQTLMKIWADVLKLDHVGVDDNFFDLGGDSILGTLILARAAQAGVRISPRQLFQHQTISALSDAIG
ncbi:MAG: amino acid adenylation domain-containing protein [Pyrinomonadaceae bacterium]|nr:amino acid adenylation domain-containing protein [Pyrinomonadaceae bacterium]